MATFVATPEPLNDPPRVKLQIDNWTASASVSIFRHDPNGAITPVRLAEAVNPFLLDAGGDGIMYDYEAWFEDSFSYEAKEALNTLTSSSITLDVSDVWLINPTRPLLSFKPDIQNDSEESYDADSNVYWPDRSQFPIIVSSGRRKSKSATMTFRTWTLVERDSLLAIMQYLDILLLNVPPSFAWDFSHQYMGFGKIDVKRLAEGYNTAGQPYREYTVPYNVSDRPAGGVQAEWNFDGVFNAFATFNDVAANYDDFADMLADIRTP
jgi:hypothetical protein